MTNTTLFAKRFQLLCLRLHRVGRQVPHPPLGLELLEELGPLPLRLAPGLVRLRRTRLQLAPGLVRPALPLGQLRFRMSGGAGGHNGIRSLIADLGSEAFPRLKIGIGGVPGHKMTGHVLGRFREEEREPAENALARAVEAVQVAASQGVSKAANTFNVREKPAKPKKDEQEIRGADCPEHEGEGR